MLVVPLITFIISIVIIAKNEGLIKPTKNKFLQAINPKKENVYIEFVATIILLIMGIIGVVFTKPDEKESLWKRIFAKNKFEIVFSLLKRHIHFDKKNQLDWFQKNYKVIKLLVS